MLQWPYMKLVVLNECFLKDEHIARLKALGDLEVFTDTTTERQAIERLQGADAAIADCFIAPLNKQVFSSVPKLKYLSLNSTGYDPVDLAAAQAHGIQISDIPGFSTDAVAEHAIALIFAVNRHIVQLDKRMHEQPYEVDPADKTQLPYLGFNLRGKTLGIIGMGNIGQRVAEIAKALGMNVIAYNRSPKNVAGVEQVSLEELLKQSDVVSLHTPLNAESENMIGAKELALMQPHALVINTARGKVVDTQALADALKNKKLGGAGLDVLAQWNTDNPLLSLENVVMTPHSAWYTQESFDNLADMVVENVEAYVSGEPQNLVSTS